MDGFKSIIRTLLRSTGLLCLCTFGANCEAKGPDVYGDMTNVYSILMNKGPMEYEPVLAQALANGSDPNGKDYRGEHALMLAATLERWRAANLLLDYGADIWIVDSIGWTVGHFVAGAGIDKMVPGDSSVAAREALASEQAAYQRFVARLKQANYPLPPPAMKQVLDLVKAGQWPPADAIRVAPIKIPAK